MADESHGDSQLLIPQEPIHRITRPLSRFLHVEAASGVVLLAATAVALVLANSGVGRQFLDFWEIKIGFSIGSLQSRHHDHLTLKHLVNDGLMVIFFFVIGLEVKRELVIGELRDLRRAALPIAGAIGGMLVPAGIFLALQAGQPGQHGWGIPMATDIAFVVGCMAVLGSRVPHSLRIMLLSLAIADDIGAILVIAIGYTDNLSTSWLLCAFAGLAVIFCLARIGVRSFAVYTVLGLGVWFCFHESGVHATIAGVLLGLMTPARSYISTGLFGQILRRAEMVITGDWESQKHRAERLREIQRMARETISPLEFLESSLHAWVGFVIMPIFALANAGVPIKMSALGSPMALAVILGLVIGKPIGITLAAWLAVKTGLARLPETLDWKIIIAGGCLCGIGFTMALFIAELALKPGTTLNASQAEILLGTAKLGVLTASVLSAIFGMVLLLVFLPKPPKPQASVEA